MEYLDLETCSDLTSLRPLFDARLDARHVLHPQMKALDSHELRTRTSEPVKAPQMPRTISQTVRAMEFRDEKGTLLGHRNGPGARPGHSYRAARRNVARLFLQKVCKRRIDPAAHLAYDEALRIRRAIVANMVERAAARNHELTLREMERMKLDGLQVFETGRS